MTRSGDLTGLRERSPSQVRQSIRIPANTMTSLANGRTYSHGRLEIPSLGELPSRVGPGRGGRSGARSSLREVIPAAAGQPWTVVH